MSKDEIKIQLIRSTIGKPKKHKETIKALGLRKINHVVTKKNNPATIGMINKVKHLIKIVE